MRRGLGACVLLCGVSVVGACVGDSTVINDSGAPDTGNDSTLADSGSDALDAAADGDGWDGYRPPPPAMGTFAWKGVGSGTNPESIAYDAHSNLFLAFSFYTPPGQFNGKMYTTAGSWDSLVAKFDPTGKVLWAQQYGGTGDDEIQAITTDPSGDVYVSFASGSPSFALGNGVKYTRQGTNYDGFIARLNGNNGDGIWIGDYSKTNENYLLCSGLAYGGGRLGITCFSSQGLALTKVSDSSALPISCLECGGMNPQYQNIYVASLDPATGKAYWGNVIAAAAQTSATSMAVDSTGAIVIDFTTFGSLVHDPTNSVNFTYQGIAGDGVLVVKLAASNGLGLWIKEFVDPSTMTNKNQVKPGGVAFDSANNVVMGGQIIGSVSFDTVMLAGGTYPNWDVYLVKLKAGFGDTIWGRTFGGSAEDDFASVGVDPWDEIFVAGGYQSADAKLDGFPFPAVPSGKAGVYIAKLDAKAQGLWATGIVSSSTSVSPRSFPNTLAVDMSSGSVAVTGEFQGTVDLGDSMPVMSPSGLDDDFVVVRTP